MATYLVDALLDRATVLLQDPTHVRWPLPELVQWLNDGQLEIAATKPNAFVRNEKLRLVPGTKQILPDDAVSLIDIVRNAGTTGDIVGNSIRLVSREILDTQIPNWHTTALENAVVKHYVYSTLDPKTFYVYPPQPAVGFGYVEAIYVAAPTDAELGGLITLDSIYAPALLNYVMFRAYSKDAEYAANAEQAKAYLSMWTAQLGGKVAAESVSSPTNTNLGGYNPNIPRAK
jgi:hypothetical protein